MNPSELERMVKAGLEPVPGSAPQNMVTIVLDGKPQQVPVDVGVYMAVSNLSALLQQVIMRLDALHAHQASGLHPKSRAMQRCIICQAENMTPEQVEELRKKIEAQNGSEPQDTPAHAVDAVVHPDIRQEESQEEQVQE